MIDFNNQSFISGPMQAIINEFLNDKKIAIVGVSVNKKKWGYTLFKMLSEKGYTVYPVNPKYSKIDDTPCYPTISELPKDITNAILAINPTNSELLMPQIIKSNIKRIWPIGVKGSKTDLIINTSRENGIEIVYNLCPMMFFSPVGIHKAHFWIKKVTSKLPHEMYV